MRPQPKDVGWVGSLFPEPIDQVKAPSDRCVCHQDCPQYETCETEALDKSSKVYYLLRCVKGKFPACANCMCMTCDRYQECKDGEGDLRGGVRYRLCNRPISITGCVDYSGSIPWRSEAYCKECEHICDLRKELVWAPRVRCDLNPIEPTKKPTEEPSVVQLDGKPTVEHPTLVRYGHETWGQYELEGRLVEEFISTDKPVRKESEFAADMVAVDAARKAAGDLPLARSFIEKGARGIRVYEDPALQEGGTLCCHLVVSKQNGGLCTGCSDQRGTPCSYARPAEHTSPEPAVAPAKPAKAKKPRCPDISVDCPERKECALNKFWKWRPCAVSTIEVPITEPTAVFLDGKWYSAGKEITEDEANAPVPQSCSGCLCLACTNKAMCHHCKDTAICAKDNARTVTCPAFSKAEGEGWTCSDCLCPKCANNKENCHDCKGPVYCSKHGGKMGLCPDFRAPDGKEQDCMHIGCLCIGCARVGEDCKECVGPIRCPKPTVQCKDYIRSEVEQVTS